MIKNIINGFSQNKIQVVSGQQCVVKNQFIEQFITHLKDNLNARDDLIYRYNLEDILVRLEFEDDFLKFKNGLEHAVGEQLENTSEQIYLIFEQIQHAKYLFPFIANLKNLNPEHIHILITSAINLTSDEDFTTFFSAIFSILFRIV